MFIENSGNIRKSRKPTSDELIKGIRSGDQTALARAITLVESTRPEDRELAHLILQRTADNSRKSVRIGITGVPGVGKSTFIEAFGGMLTARGEKVAVLAVDPTSTLSKGSILGDKTRMVTLVNDPNAYIRPSASGANLGGVARSTRETIALCEAAGYGIILVETVGVGQSETTVHGMVDFFLLLKLAGAGDELQGIKRGIMEMADSIVINKADGENKAAAKQAMQEFRRALHLYPPKENGWTPKVLSCSSLEKEGIEEIWQVINEYVRDTRASGSFDRKRERQNKNWFLTALESRLKEHFYNHPRTKKAMNELLKKVEQGVISPFQAANELMEKVSGILK
ncbi:methylmalonyl Co-A mutase-associated GTPase MeaB [Zeaxanthinibacter sp. PT1]|uniref:methylmalonyl Co-A mutase-associated GTPase MeaB n=1 Tax=Zeaxanthinibacter TaxID=561554 RepID=UPI00234A2842|nr:methylmalonyl Co-A mutase-associated GTPase MeaB [Zeaxanthinibacter sp. PT1]MDC6352560.1 methylmalonyl Co-A mutase-associated GTPase MeaB [Zeaxanthinibacter sp. PT1]